MEVRQVTETVSKQFCLPPFYIFQFWLSWARKAASSCTQAQQVFFCTLLTSCNKTLQTSSIRNYYCCLCHLWKFKWQDLAQSLLNIVWCAETVRLVGTNDVGNGQVLWLYRWVFFRGIFSLWHRSQKFTLQPCFLHIPLSWSCRRCSLAPWAAQPARCHCIFMKQDLPLAEPAVAFSWKTLCSCSC